jgi:hypothetical protein
VQLAGGIPCNNAKLNKTLVLECSFGSVNFNADFKAVNDSLTKKNIDLEYNDSFSGRDEGIEMYSYQEKRDSFLLLHNLNFESGRLKGISVNFTSMDIQNETSFLNKIKNSIGPRLSFKTSNFDWDTSSNSVNKLESSCGKVFHLRIYDIILGRKISTIF